METILITGAAGFLGSLLAKTLAKDTHESVQLILTDVIEPGKPDGVNATAFKVDLTDHSQVQRLFQTDFGIPDTIYCMHGIMSRGSEDNFDLGIKINIDSVLALLQAARYHSSQRERPIKFIFTSSLAVYGGPLPEVVTPSTIAVPQSAYGMEKLTCELYINEFSRRGFVDGRICRLPTIVVRPGAPSAATSSFLSAIIREPLMGQRTVCPIGNSIDSPELDLEAWLASPSVTVKNLAFARSIPAKTLFLHTRVICLPGFTATIRDMLNALNKVGGQQALDMVDFKDDETNRRIVSSWPAKFDCSYALKLGFNFDQGGLESVVADFQRTLTKS